MGEYFVFTDEGGGRTVGNHEAAVESTLLDEEGGQTTERGIDESFDTTFGNGGEFVNANGEIVKRLGGVLAMKVASGE